MRQRHRTGPHGPSRVLLERLPIECVFVDQTLEGAAIFSSRLCGARNVSAVGREKFRDEITFELSDCLRLPFTKRRGIRILWRNALQGEVVRRRTAAGCSTIAL